MVSQKLIFLINFLFFRHTISQECSAPENSIGVIVDDNSYGSFTHNTIFPKASCDCSIAKKYFYEKQYPPPGMDGFKMDVYDYNIADSGDYLVNIR